jgi:hypothetical protein
MKKECEHINTRKLFYQDTRRATWVRTNISICLDCDCVLKLKEVEFYGETKKK